MTSSKAFFLMTQKLFYLQMLLLKRSSPCDRRYVPAHLAQTQSSPSLSPSPVSAQLGCTCHVARGAPRRSPHDGFGMHELRPSSHQDKYLQSRHLLLSDQMHTESFIRLR